MLAEAHPALWAVHERAAPEAWKEDPQRQPALRLGTLSQDTLDQSVSAKEKTAAA